MEYYFYILVVVALFLKLGLYFCWYHMRRRAALAREVHIVMPDGTTRRAMVTGRPNRRTRREDRQILAHSDSLQHTENQGFEERPAYPHVMTGNVPVGAFPEPPPYAGIIGGMGSANEWKLPKYEDLPPPYTNATPTETGCSATEVPIVPSSPAPAPPQQHSPPPPSLLQSSQSTTPATNEQLPLQQQQQQPPHQVINIDGTSTNHSPVSGGQSS